MLEAFHKADDVLLQAVRGISDLIITPGLINLDFADVRTVMAEMGLALMGAASAIGENRAIEAAQKAISSPLLEDISIQGARGVLINITGGPDLCLHEVNEAASMIQEEAHDDANIIFGAVIDENMTDEIRITVIATGFGEVREEKKVVQAAPGARARGQCREHRHRRAEKSQSRSPWHHHRRSRHADLATQEVGQRRSRDGDVEQEQFRVQRQSGRRRQVRHPDVSAPPDGLRRLALSQSLRYRSVTACGFVPTHGWPDGV